MRWSSAATRLAFAMALAPCALAQNAVPAAPQQAETPDAQFAQAEAAAQTARSIEQKSTAAGKSAIHSSARFTVLLDPAHGGKDAGALLSNAQAKTYAAPKLMEKDATLDFARELSTALTSKGVAARLTRSDDATLSDNERVKEGSSLGAGVCITLHATAIGAGVHVFYPLAQFGLPNHSFLDQWTAADVPPSGQSQPLARALAAALKKSQVPATLEPATDPVISREHCTAIAIELAPLRSPDSAAITAADPQYQQRVATAVAQALAEWREQRQTLDAGAAAYGRKAAR